MLVFFQVGQAVAVRVASGTVVTGGVFRVEVVLDLPAVGQSVVIGFGVLRVGAVLVFFQVGQAVVVGVAAGPIAAGWVVGVKAVLVFPVVGQAVAIAINEVALCLDGINEVGRGHT